MAAGRTIFMAERKQLIGARCIMRNSRTLVRKNDSKFSVELNRLAPNLPTTGEVKIPCAEEKRLRPLKQFVKHSLIMKHPIDGVKLRLLHSLVVSRRLVSYINPIQSQY